MISFDKLWTTMQEKNMSQYTLMRDFDITTAQLDKLRKNGNVGSHTLNELCKALKCDLSDIAEYVDEE